MGVKAFLKPSVRILYNGIDKTKDMDWISISTNDFEGDEADTLNIVLKYSSARVRLRDEVEVYVDEHFLGKFYINAIKVDYKKSFTLEAVSVDFMSEFVMKKNRTFKDTSYQSIIDSIAKENGYEVKAEFERKDEVVTLEQHDQSDLSLCKKIADELELTFCVKNKTLIFYDRDKEIDRVTYSYAADDALSLNWQTHGKNIYKSCEVKWQDTRTSKKEVAVAGKGNPVLKVTSMQKDKNAALKYAQRKLKEANNNEINGNMQIMGEPFFAGGYIEILFENDETKKYIIKAVRHKIDKNWTTDIEFF